MQVVAHKPVTSKYTYSEDVYPIVKAHCAGCHVPGGIAPMSLLTYEEARPWAESIRLELTSAHMPPWYGDPSVAPLRDDHALSPRDLDVVLTWVTGGTPPGPPMKNAAGAAPRRIWARGRPDLVIQVPEAVTLAADKREDSREFVLRDANDRDRIVTSADLLPGNAAIVHDATIFTRAAGGTEPAAVLATWIPGEPPQAPAAGEGFAWRAGEQLVARIHYKKNWKLENKTATDRSTVGLYFAKAPSTRVIRSVGLRSGESFAVEDALHAVAVRASDTTADTKIEIDAVRPDGSRVRVAGFGARPGWSRRYWLARAVDFPRGTRLEAKTTGERLQPIQLWLDVLP
jgi:hypothetical protein